MKQGLVEEQKVNRSVTYLLTEMMKLGLFENPYVDPKKALEVVNNSASQERADIAHRKSVVLLRNEKNVLPLTDEKIKGIKLYVEVFPGGDNGESTQKLKESIQNYDSGIAISDRSRRCNRCFCLGEA